MPHLGDIPEEAEAREFGVDNAVDDATCCVPGRGLPEFPKNRRPRRNVRETDRVPPPTRARHGPDRVSALRIFAEGAPYRASKS